jgi:hypothetical protein
VAFIDNCWKEDLTAFNIPDLQNFRQALAVLQRQVDELDELKVSHYQEIVDHEEEVWEAVQSKVCMYSVEFTAQI